MSEFKVAEFYRWFASEANRIFEDVEQSLEGDDKPGSGLTNLLEEVGERLGRVDSNLTFELVPAYDGKSPSLVISAGGMREMIPTVNKVVDLAPKDLFFSVQAFKPAREIGESPIVLHRANGQAQEIHPAEVLCSVTPRVPLLDIELYFPDFSEKDLYFFAEAGFYLLDYCLGEFKVMTTLGSVHFGSRDTLEKNDDEGEKFPLAELPELFGKMEESLSREVARLKSISEKERLQEFLGKLKTIREIDGVSAQSEFIFTIKFWSLGQKLGEKDLQRLFELANESGLDLHEHDWGSRTEFFVEVHLLVESASLDFGAWIEDCLERLCHLPITIEGIQAMNVPAFPEVVGMVGALLESENHLPACLIASHWLQSEEVDTWVESHPTDIYRLLQYGAIAYENIGDLETALTLINEALEFDTELEYEVALLARASSLLLELDKPEEALERINEAFLREMESAELYYHRAQIYVTLDHVDEALDDLEKSFELGNPSELLEVVHQDDLLDPLKEEPRYTKLIQSMLQ